MEQRLSMVTLGVADLDESRRFYRVLGWQEGPGSTEEIVFFQVGGMLLGLWDRDALAEDSAVTDAGGWGGITLAFNTRNRDEVDRVMQEAEAAGAVIGRQPAETFWGGYSGVFIDPAGHPWEVAHNPFWTVNEDGSVGLEG